MTIQEKAREWAEKEYPGWGDSVKIAAYLAGAAEAMRWLPVSERLPEEGMCLVIGKNAMGKQIVISYYSEKSGFISISNVTHWAPLPLHPEKENL